MAETLTELYRVLNSLWLPTSLIPIVCRYHEYGWTLDGLSEDLLPIVIESCGTWFQASRIVVELISRDRVDLAAKALARERDFGTPRYVYYYPHSIRMYRLLHQICDPKSWILAYPHGNLELIQSIADSKSEKRETLAAALETNTIDVIRYLAPREPLIPKALCYAASNPDVEVLKFLIAEFELIPTNEVLKRACKHGHLNSVVFLVETYHLKPDQDDLISQNLRVVQYLITQCGLVPNSKSLAVACTGVNSDLIRYLIEDQGLKPSLTDLCQYSVLSDPDLFRLAVQASGLKPNRVLITTACKYCAPSSLAWLVDTYGVQFTLQDFKAAFCYNYSATTLFLSRQFGFQPTAADFEEASEEQDSGVFQELVELYPI